MVAQARWCDRLRAVGTEWTRYSRGMSDTPHGCWDLQDTLLITIIIITDRYLYPHKPRAIFPPIFFQFAQQSVVFEWHIFMPGTWIFFTDVTQDNDEISLILHSTKSPCLHPVSTFQTKVPSRAAWFPSNVYHAYDIKNNCAAVGNCCVAFFCHARGCAA